MKRRKRIKDYRFIHPFMGKFYYEGEPLLRIQLTILKFSVFFLHVAPLDGLYGFEIMGFGIDMQYY